MAGATGAAGLGLDIFSQLFKFGTGAYQAGIGALKLRELEKNRPKLNVDPAYLYNAQLAGQRASQGFGNQFLNLAGDSIERGLGSTINAALSTGQGLNSINNSFQTSTDAFKQLLMADALQKQRNQDVLMNAKKDLAEERMKAFNWNELIPYQQKFTQYTNMINSGQQNMYGGIKGTGADVAALGYGNNYYGGGGGFGNGGASGYWGG